MYERARAKEKESKIGREQERARESERANIPFPSDAAERFTHAWKSLK